MKKVIFVAPVLMPATVRFIDAVSKQPQIQLGLISTQHPVRLPPALKARIQHCYQIANCLDPGQLAIAAREIGKVMGGIDRLFGVLEELQVPIAQVRDYLKIPGMNAKAATNFRDKSQMKQTLREAGVPCAKHCLVTAPQQAWGFIKDVGYPIVVKPPAGAGARSTFQVNSDEQLKDYLNAFAPTEQNPTLLEEFIQGEEFSFEAISIDGKVTWNSLTRYYPSPLEVIKNPWIQWCVLLPREVDHQNFDPIRKTNQDALNALGMVTGLTHMEWFRRADGTVAVSEVGARPPGAQIMSLMSYAHDRNFYEAWAYLMIHDEFHPPKREYAAGAAYLRGIGHGRVKAVHGLDQAQKEVGPVVVEAKLPKLGAPRASSYEGEGYVIVRHRETDVVKKALHRLVSLIRVEYE